MDRISILIFLKNKNEILYSNNTENIKTNSNDFATKVCPF